MSEIKSESQPTWADIEVVLATEIVEESKKKSIKEMVYSMDCDGCRTGSEQPCVDSGRYQ